LLLIENGMEFIEINERLKIVSALTASDTPWTVICSSVNEDMKNACQQVIEVNTSKTEK
jgi:hypothetical protein